MDGIEVYVGSMGSGVQWDPVTENHLVPVYREMCKYTIIPRLPGPIEPTYTSNPAPPRPCLLREPLHLGIRLLPRGCLLLQLFRHKVTILELSLDVMAEQAQNKPRFKLKALLSYSQSKFETGRFQAGFELARPLPP